MAVITAAEYKTWGGISVSTYDTRITNLIGYIQKRVERYCGRAFDTATFTEKYDGAGSDCITVKNGPITSITSVTVYTASDSQVLDSTAYTFSTGEDARLWLYGAVQGRTGMDRDGFARVPFWGVQPRFPDDRQNVQVVYVGGYGSGGATVPDDLKLAMFETVAEAMALSAPAAGGTTQGGVIGQLQSQTLGNNSESYRPADQAFDKFRDRFGPFRRAVYG